MINKIKTLAKKYADEFIAIRHHLHQHPELSYQEFETSKFIQEKLNSFGIPFEVKAKTGVVGLIKGKNPESRIIALRADIDALPIQEENNIAYKSKNDGVMHACGHDVHTTCLLGAAKILEELKSEWSGTIKLIFQPGEERNPGGASLMIKDGVLENPAPEAILALHVNPLLEVGKLSFREGQVMASADELFFTFKGKGGHAAAPHWTSDTILAASEFIVSLQQIISRNRPPLIPSVLSITSFHGGHTTNVIPAEVKLMGTFRAMDEAWRFDAHKLIKAHAKHFASLHNIEIDAVIDVGYPMVNNDAALHIEAKSYAEKFMTPALVEETEVRLGAEDFGFYAEKIPGCFFRLGTKNESKNITAGVHTALFNIDESAIEIGMGIMAWLGANVNYKA